MQRFTSSHSGQGYQESARRALRRLRIALLVWLILLAATVLWFIFIP